MFLKKKSKETMWKNMKICSTLLVNRLTKMGAIYVSEGADRMETSIPVRI